MFSCLFEREQKENVLDKNTRNLLPPHLNPLRLSLFMLFITVTNDTNAAIQWISDITLSPAAMTYSGPADSIVPGQIIGAAWSTNVNVGEVFYCGILLNQCSKSTMQPSGSAVYAGFSATLDGIAYAVFETGVPGVGFILGLKDPNATAWSALTTSTTQTFPASGTGAFSDRLGWTAQVTFVKTGQSVVTGTYSVPQLNPAVLTAWNISNNSEDAQVYINPVTITFTATGCRVTTGSLQIDMGLVDGRTLPTTGNYTPSKPFNIGLSCDPGINVYAVASDQSNPGNTSQAVSLTPDSTASGVGVQLFYNTTGPLTLGADSSAAGTAGQFLIQNNVPGGTMSLPFQARYIRTGPLVPGTANALAGITFSYQ